ncbi:MAG: hypothetical protein ACI9C1_001004 [Candidatus Aldehydirespiratoraceae bacterium]|jgi:hypothetical protein
MNNEIIHIDGQEFVLSPMEGKRGNDGPFTLKKPRWMIDQYLQVAEKFVGANMVEVGLWDGGSTAFLASSFQPEVLIGFELAAQPLHRLEAFLSGSRHQDRVHTYLGVDQADGDTLRRHIGQHLDGPLDVVVDDASHILGPSEATFECLFPMLRPGGIYILEDWTHEHKRDFGTRQALARGDIDASAFSNIEFPLPFPNPLSRLVIDALLATSNDDGVISKVVARHGWAEIHRGDTDIDPNTFSLLELIGPYGRRVNPRSLDDI